VNIGISRLITVGMSNIEFRIVEFRSNVERRMSKFPVTPNISDYERHPDYYWENPDLRATTPVKPGLDVNTKTSNNEP
jgi:hypothetical protein